MRLLAPAYAYPEADPGYWRELMAAAPVLGHVIMNPGNGPGHVRDPAWVQQVERLRSAGIEMLGYLDLAYSRKPFEVLVREARTWRRWYGILSFFLDCAPSSDARHTGDVADVLRTTGRADHLTANPGTRAHGDVALHFDTVVEHEGSARSVLISEADAAGTPRVPRGPQVTSRAWIVHGASAPAARRALDGARRAGIDQVWVTDLAGRNPYRDLPTYWEWLTSAVADPTSRQPGPGPMPG